MSRRLFTVEDTCTIRGGGTVLVPGIAPEGEDRFRIGDALRLRRPDVSEIVATIDGIDFLNVPHDTDSIVVRLPKSDVPLGTEVWSA